MTKKLITDIINKLFGDNRKRVVVVLNRDGFLNREDVIMALQYAQINFAKGSSLDLRILWETEWKSEQEKRCVFLMVDEFEILEDIRREVEFFSFHIRSMFRFYHWDTIKNESLATLEWLYNQPQLVPLDEIRTQNIVSEYGFTVNRVDEAMLGVKQKWNELLEKPNFDKPSEWMPDVSRLLLDAIEMERWHEMEDLIENTNNAFQEFLKKKYVNIVSSTCRKDAPRIVTHVLPFINKQGNEKSALIVIDGMNYWQSILLGNSLEEHFHVRLKYECIYSWLPSITELSRQAIFRASRPANWYIQNPQSEERLWREYWESKKLPKFQQFYQHSGSLDVENSIIKLAYVSTDLDEKMHASENFYYLYDNTKRWVDDKPFLENIKYLLDSDFKLYITTDHGNIETVPYRKLEGSDKLGANDISLRHITIPEEAEKTLFEAQYAEHFMQIDENSRTYFAIKNETFTNKNAGITHGGTHWLEVLIPFITATK
ncbi:hypothetical protein ING2E5B_1791 [Fermentimonas caenicola]|jgi:hypothetical protein|uniref:Uncharacterized protein n=1 Tax=Fermentimonas caenicola TaxID=1562970 RepID=A0A098C0Y3_9BACT|nr:hypothetical protein ING2E5B_1791 [Fermentimonas caenicola]HHT21877.1 PglZ domain-containing protein [Bacteroidales bacterium]